MRHDAVHHRSGGFGDGQHVHVEPHGEHRADTAVSAGGGRQYLLPAE